jgi:hypothetical protein
MKPEDAKLVEQHLSAASDILARNDIVCGEEWVLDNITADGRHVRHQFVVRGYTYTTRKPKGSM